MRKFHQISRTQSEKVSSLKDPILGIISSLSSSSFSAFLVALVKTFPSNLDLFTPNLDFEAL